MDILNRTFYQLSKIENLLNTDLENKNVTINYLIFEANCKLLDYAKIRTYLTTKKVENHTFLKEINIRCANIINLWNKDFLNLPINVYTEPFVVNTDQKKISLIFKFHAVYLTKEKWECFNTEVGKKEFLENYQYESYQISDIAKNCALIMNYITAFYPTTVPDDLKDRIPSQPTVMKRDKLKVPQIALIKVYEGIQITRENADQIAAEHGYKAKNSGEGLFQDYTHYCSTANRKGKPTPCTPKKLKNKIQLLESVVVHLSESAKRKALDEITILKTIFENEYQ